MFDCHWNQKRPLGTLPNTEHPLWPYVDLCLPMLEGQGPTPMEFARGLPLIQVGTAVGWKPGPLGGLSPVYPSTTGGWYTAGAGQYTGQNFTLSLWLNAGPNTGSAFYVANTGPYNTSGWAWVAQAGATHNFKVLWSASNYWQFRSNSVAAANTWQHWVVVRSGGSILFYLNGVLDINNSVGTQETTPLAAPGLCYLNCYYGTTSTSSGSAAAAGFDNVLFLKGIALSAAQVADLYARPWQLFARRPSLAGVPTIEPTIIPTPGTLYANGTNQTLGLQGYDRSWTPSSTTTFSLVSPPVGVSISSQLVSTGTAASIMLATGSATGSVGITDGTATATIPVAAVSFAAAPAVIPADHPGHITLTLTGYGTLWTGGTTFSVSGVSGASLVGQSVTSNTSATVVVTTGSGTGTLSISDGTHTGTVAVTSASISATSSATTIVATGTYAVAMKGVDTVWTQETASTLFSASGIAGASVSNVAVVSDTYATVMLSLGSSKSGGSVSIVDNSTGATSGPLAVTAAPQGSLLATGQCLLAHTGGSTGSFGSRSAATLAFRFEAVAQGTPAGSGGTTVIGWGTNPTGSPELAVYYPASGLLVVTAYGGDSGGYATNTLSVSIPVQIGIGYHVLISWGTTPQIYVCGALTATASFSNVSTFPYSQVQVGGNAGSGIAMDHRVSDLAIWSNYAASAADALALANGETPLQVSSPAVWFPLGGGTTGATPSLTDAWLGDYTGNGNTLTVATGSLSGLQYAAPIAPGLPTLVAAYVAKSGKLAVFGTTGAGPGNPVAPITAVTGTPTIYRDGTAIQVGPPTWLSNTKDSPFVAYLLQCGGVEQVAIAAGGSNYSSSPTVSASGGGGSGLTFGTPVVQSGITGYTVVNGGSGFAEPPAVTITDSGGSGSGALAYAIVSGGVVTNIILTNGGSGYVKPVVSFSGGGGSGAAATASMSGGVITGFNITAQGSGYNNPPSISISVPPTNYTGQTSYIPASAIAVVYGSDASHWGGTAGAIRAVIPAAGGLLGCGSGYSATALPTISVGVGTSPVQLATTVTGGAITAIHVPSSSSTLVSFAGGGYPSPVALNIHDPAGTGAVASANTSGGSFGAVTVSNEGSGYTNPSITVAASGSTVVIVPTVSNYIAYVPVTSAGSGYNSPPTLTVSDATGTGAVLSPIMSGAAPGDTFTYTAPGAWINPTITVNGNACPMGGIQPVTGAAMTNWTGQREGATGGLTAFSQAPTMLAGANAGEQPCTAYSPMYMGKNRINQGGGWNAQGGAFTYTFKGTTYTATNPKAAVGTPVSWTNPASITVGMWLYGPLGTNPIDTMGWPGQFGQWTLQYDDPNVNTTSAMYLALNGTPINLSGSGATATAVMSGGSVASITVTDGGSGYEGAFVSITGGGGQSGYLATATAVVTDGAVTEIKVLQPGAFYTGTPTVTIYGTTVSGTTVKAIFDIEPSGTTWQTNAGISVAAPSVGGVGYWTVSNVWVVAPDAITREPVASIDTTKPYAPDDSVIAALTTPTGRTPGSLRFMDVNAGFGGGSNFILPTDLLDPTQMVWGNVSTTYSCWFQFARRINTNPSSGTYAWSSTKVYGNQPFFYEQDAPYAVTANLTAGSATITNLSTGLMVGSAVSGTGVPSGAYIATISGTSGTLSAAATASGTGVSLTITNPNYITLPTGDNGQFIAPIDGYLDVAIELRSTTPHGLQTGQLTELWSPITGNSIPVTNAVNWNPNALSGGVCYVTGPYTLVMGCYVAPSLLPNAPFSNAPQAVNSTTEIDLTMGGAVAGWYVSVQVPSPNCVPWEATAALIAGLPGCAYWVNIPATASDALVASIAQRIAANIGPTNPVYLEFGNEWWNGGGAYSSYGYSVSKLLSYVTPGTTVAGYYTSDGRVPPQDIYGSVTVLSGHAYDVFEAAWTAAGLAGSRIVRTVGSWFFGGGYRTQEILETAHRWGIEVDHTNVAPYLDLPGDLPILTAFSPAGSITNNAGSWPMDAINDLMRHWMPYSANNQGLWAGHADACALFGQPMNGSGVTGTNATATALLTATTIASVAVTKGGSNYYGPVAQVAGGGGGTASLTVSISGPGGSITGITINSSSGFTSIPTILIVDTPGSGATATCSLSGGSVGGTITITSGGSGYKNPKVSFYGGGGSGAAATATESGGVITGITVTSGGSGYTSAPAVIITDSVGSGAAASATLTATSVGSVVVSNAGVGYLANPTVSFSGGGGSGAAATATASGGVVTGATVTAHGSGYTSPPSVAITGGGGGLTGGTLYCCYTFVDGQGRETTVGLSRSSAGGLGSGTVPVMTMPAWPTWAQSMNIYLSFGAAGSETLYTSIPRSQYGYGNTYPVGSQIPLNGTLTGTGQKPPSTNLAAANIAQALPTPATYEGGVEIVVPGSVPFATFLRHDSFAHPSARDMVWGWHAACQIGGASITNYYQLYAGETFTDMWVLAFGTAQPPGDGLAYAYEGSIQVAVSANRFATIQGGYPADAHSHVGGEPGNTAPALQGFRDWIDASSPIVSPPNVGRRRRWFSGLASNAARLSR